MQQYTKRSKPDRHIYDRNYMWNLKKIQMNLFTKQKKIHIADKFMDRGEIN